MYRAFSYTYIIIDSYQISHFKNEDSSSYARIEKNCQLLTKSVGEVHSWSPDKYNANKSMVEIRRKGAYNDAPESLIRIFHGINRYLVEQDAAMN